MLFSFIMVSCEMEYAYYFSIWNLSEGDTINIRMSYTIEYKIYYKEINPLGDFIGDTIFKLPPSPEGNSMIFYLNEKKYIGDYKQDGITPIWEYIKFIKIGNRILDDAEWKDEKKWEHRVTNNDDGFYCRYSLKITGDSFPDSSLNKNKRGTPLLK